MNPEIVPIGTWQLAIAVALVLIAQASSFVCRLGLVKDIGIGTVRTFAQLFLMGYALKVIFRVNSLFLTLGVFVVMIVIASRIVRGRVREKETPFAFPMLVSMLISHSVVSIMVTGVIIGSEPWWKPQYFIPVSGMIIGNSMSALAIALERLFSDLRAKRDIVEMRLALGADYREASWDILRDAMKAGMIPSVNSMMGVGIVFLPGMMTGQILAGADPLTAIRYQIVVMLMLVGSTAIGSLIVVLLTRKRCFGKGQQLVLKKQGK